MNYIPLNIKTEYDLMNSLIKIDDLVLYAKNNNISTLGITDSNLFGTMEFINKCSLNNIKPIIGIEINIDEINLLLYAKNYNGLVNLFKIVSYKNIDDYIDLSLLDDNILVVCDIENYDALKDKYNNVYIKFYDDKSYIESKLLTNNIVYINLIRYFKESDKEYFKYIKYIDKSLTINDSIEIEDSYFINNIKEDYAYTTYQFSNLIDIKIPEVKRHIPIYRENSNEYLKALAKKGLEKRLNGNVSDIYKQRLMYELSIIEKMNFVDYFLIVYDFVLFAKKNNILVGPGRGSGAASLVNYSLGIINIDPLKYNLIFERFLNPDRLTMPDIDIDFDSLKREEVIEYVSNKYGRSKTARIISFNTMAPKQIIRDVSRVLELNSILVDRLCKNIKDEKDFDMLKNNYEFMSIVNRNDDARKLIDICSKLCTLKKNTSMHAAGVVISDIELSNIMPLYKSNGVILTGYSMEYIESLGLLKMDFLSIKNLNTISNIINDIKKDGIDLDINNIDLNDKRTLNMFKHAYTSGVFQFESDGMRNFLKSLEVDDFNTLVDAIALYRPGPREMIDEYILRKKGKKKITYLINELEPILKSTYGIIIYQEQVLEILRTIGGYSYSEADIIRRAMSKKKAIVIENEKEKFINRVISKGYEETIANELYELIIKFSNYGFNKSHSVVYSLVAFQMAYLKAYYSKYFMKNLLNMNKSSDKIKEYIEESKILGINFKMADINLSTHEFRIFDKYLVFPFSIIKSVGINVCEEIINERNKRNFDSFYDFMIRCYSKSVNKKVVISLVECGVFDSFNINKKAIVDNIDEIINYVTLCKDLSIVIEEKPNIEDGNDYTDKENIDNEIKNYGFYLSHHPVTKYDRGVCIKLDSIDKYFNRTITTILFVENIKTIKTKNNDKMSFVKLSDEFKSIEGIIFPEQYKKIYDVEKNNIYKIMGKVEKRNNDYQLIIYNMIKLN
ncbi:MAG: DNA polymerase III subunit alpha [bacterium]|nr:DNA polymerase III subunit alpha [bacterium]